MARAVTIWNGTSGLNVKADPVRIKPSGQPGQDLIIVPLALCVNCSVDDRGRLSRRDGCDATTRTESWHSLFAYDDICLGVLSTGSLCRIAPDFSYSTLASVNSIAKMDYCYIDGKVYYGNGTQYGYIEANAAQTWGMDTVDTSLFPDSDYRNSLTGPPAAHHLEQYSGRMYAAYNNFYIGFSERDFFGLWHLDVTEQKYEAWIRIMKAVTDGLWIGDQKQISFYKDPGTSAATKIPAASYGAVQGTPVRITGQEIGIDFLQNAGEIIVFMGQRGVCVGGPGGLFTNLTINKLEFRDDNDKLMTFFSGAGLECKGHYLAMMDKMGVDMNLRNLALSQTTGWTFNSFCNFQEKYLGASSSGIFTLRGYTDDAGTDIDSQFEFAVDMGRPCSLARIDLDGEFNGFMKLTLTSSSTFKGRGPAISRSYILKPNSIGNYQDALTSALDAHNGVGSYWTFNFQNYNGSDFSIDRIRVEPVYQHFT